MRHRYPGEPNLEGLLLQHPPTAVGHNDGGADRHVSCGGTRRSAPAARPGNLLRAGTHGTLHLQLTRSMATAFLDVSNHIDFAIGRHLLLSLLSCHAMLLYLRHVFVPKKLYLHNVQLSVGCTSFPPAACTALRNPPVLCIPTSSQGKPSPSPQIYHKSTTNLP